MVTQHWSTERTWAECVSALCRPWPCRKPPAQPQHCLDDWGDQGRDIAQFLAYHLPSSPTTPSNSLPVHLPRQDETLGESRMRFGFQQRTLVVIAHSFSGTASYVLHLLSFRDIDQSLLA